MNNKNIDLKTMLNVIDNIGAFVYTKNLKGEYTYANNLVLELFDISLEELKGKTDYDFFNLEDIEELIENDNKVFNGKEIETLETLQLKQTGEFKYYLAAKKPLFDEEGNINGMFGISTDITEQKLLEKKILEQKKFLDIILDNVDAYIYIKDENRNFKYVNSKVAKLFNLPAEEIINKKDTSVIEKELADSFWESDRQVFETNSKVIIEEEFFDNKGNKSFYWSNKIPYTLNGTRCILGFSSDVTKLKEKDSYIKEQNEILNQQSKLTAMGEMIENIAHQWRQPLSVISTVTTGISFARENNFHDEEQLQKGLNTITKSVEHLSETIEYFRDYLHKTQEKNLLDIVSIVNIALDLVLIKIKNNNIKIQKNIENISLYTYKNDIIQIIFNLIKNSIDAFEEQNTEEKFIQINAYENSSNAYLEIIDNAGGIAEDIINRVFEPYFTTKHKSQGTGIGLYMCQKIAKDNLQGLITVKNIETEFNNKNYKGSKFILKLPILN